MCTGDTGAALHAEFNKHVHEYTANYTNPVTSGQIQDELREKEIEDEEIESSLQQQISDSYDYSTASMGGAVFFGKICVYKI